MSFIADQIRVEPNAAAQDRTCRDCEYFDNGAAGPDGHSDCLNSNSPRFQTYAHSEACRSFHPSTTAVCPTCEGGGWESYGLGHNDPHFRECETCNNPEGLPSP